MQAIQQARFGSADELRLVTLADPEPREGQVRIAVAAAGVHLLDTTLRAGCAAGPAPLPELPAIPGREVAGVVDAVGPGVDAVWLGRHVVAHLGAAGGGYAELATAPVGSLHQVPGDLDPAEAIAMIGTGRTAAGVVEAVRMTADDTVLVLAAAGGLGSLLVQIGLVTAGRVIGAAGGPDKTARVRELGATAVDYREPGWTAAVEAATPGHPVTVVLDGVGGVLGRQALELLAPGGRHVLLGWSSGAPTELTATDVVARGLTVTSAIGPRLLQRPGGLRPLERRALAALAAGQLRPLLTDFPLAEAAAAHRALEGRSTVGKVVLRTRRPMGATAR